jgi:hypothetical protein
MRYLHNVANLGDDKALGSISPFAACFLRQYLCINTYTHNFSVQEKFDNKKSNQKTPGNYLGPV